METPKGSVRRLHPTHRPRRKLGRLHPTNRPRRKLGRGDRRADQPHLAHQECNLSLYTGIRGYAAPVPTSRMRIYVNTTKAPERGRIAITNTTPTIPTVTDEMLGIVLIVRIMIRQRQNTCITKMVTMPGELQLVLRGSYCVTWVLKINKNTIYQCQVSFQRFRRLRTTSSPPTLFARGVCFMTPIKQCFATLYDAYKTALSMYAKSAYTTQVMTAMHRHQCVLLKLRSNAADG